MSTVFTTHPDNLPDPSLENYLQGVIGAVEATDCERHYLWREETQEYGHEWKSQLFGYGRHIGNVGDMPVCVSLLCQTVRGHKLLFYHATSRVVDHQMIRDWLDRVMPATARRPDGSINKTDAMNFHNIFPR